MEMILNSIVSIHSDNEYINVFEIFKDCNLKNKSIQMLKKKKKINVKKKKKGINKTFENQSI